MNGEVIPNPEAPCAAVREALTDVSASLQRLRKALKAMKTTKKAAKKKAAKGKKR